MRSTLLGLALLALALPATAATAVLAEGDLPGSGWVSLRVRTDGALAQATIELDDAAVPYAAAYAVYDSDDRLVSHSGFLHGGEEVSASVVAGGTNGATLVAAQPVAESAGISHVMNGRVGEYTIVLWAASAQTSGGSWRLTAQPGVELLASDSGGEAFLLQGAQFEQVAGARVAALPGDALHAHVAATYEREMSGRPVWWFFAPDDHAGLSGLRGVDALVATTPGGEVECGCVAFEGGAPGSYRFEATGAGVGDVWLMGADPRRV